ncbi:MAG: AraC family ligand binding domain-containing protein, partial [Chloroflexota bacterium]
MSTPRHQYTDLRSLALKVEIPGVISNLLGWGVFEPKWWRNFKHTHSYFEVCYAYAGSAHFHINGDRLPIQQNDLFVARPGDLHEIITAQGSELGIYFWSFTLTLQQDSIVQPDLFQLFNRFSNAEGVIAQRPEMLPSMQAFTHELEQLPAGFVFGLQAITQKLLLDT